MAITSKDITDTTHWQPEFTKVIDGKAVRFRDVCVHEITLGDVEDPNLWVAEPIWQWQQTEPGKFVMEHAEEAPYWVSGVNYNNWGTSYRIMARLSEQNETFWRLLCSSNK